MASQSQTPNTGFIHISPVAQKVIFLLTLFFTATPYSNPPLALFLGLIIALTIGHPYLHLNSKVTHKLLQISVIGLGFGMNLGTALQTGKEGFLLTIASITLTFVLGYIVAKLLKLDKKLAYLISAGTAICGGSAIAAVSPVIKAEEKQITMALGTVFILNAIALFVFPVIGHALNMTQQEFGLWSAIAIHDTSSVVGAAGKYGDEALNIATTVKLARALWIIPVAIISSFIFKNKGGKIKIPYFIGLFVVAMLINTYIPGVGTISPYITAISKSGLTITLFLIGSGLSLQVIKAVGIKPLILGILLWLFIGTTSLLAILGLI